MTREEVAEWLEFMQEEEHNKADSIVPCTNEIALGIAVEALKQPQIVRCKDCKHGTESILFGNNCVWCTRLERHNYLNWFCADGEGGD